MATSEADKSRAKAKNYAYILLRNRPRSEQELRGRLRMKGFDDGTVAIVIADLTKAGYLNDAKFAKFLVESRMHANPVGDVILKHQLQSKGVSDEVIEGALAEKGKAYDEFELAAAMAKERFARFKKLDRRKASKRVYDFLLRRGFKYDTIRRVIDTVVRGPGAGSQGPEDVHVDEDR